MFEAPLALAFGAGLFSTINPCGFAMLPAYLAYFLGLEANATETDARSSLIRALWAGATVSAGFLLVFGIVAILVTSGLDAVQEIASWVTIVIGAGMVVLGVAMLRGFQLALVLPKLNKGGKERSTGSMFVFGISYAIASLSCALPLFIVYVSTVVDGVSSSVASFIAYASGMVLVLMGLTVSMAMARQGLLQWLRKAMRYVDRVAGALLIVAGVYTMYFWIFDLATDPGEDTGRGPITFMESLVADIQNWVNDQGPTRIGLILAVFVAAVAILVLAWPAPRREDSDDRRTVR